MILKIIKNIFLQVGLVQICIVTFSKESPVYAKLKQPVANQVQKIIGLGPDDNVPFL